MTFNEWYNKRFGTDPNAIDLNVLAMAAAWEAGQDAALKSLAAAYKKLYTPDELRTLVGDLEARANPLEHFLKVLRSPDGKNQRK